MKQLIKHIALIMGVLLRWLCPHSVALLWQSFRNHVYTAYHRQRFAAFGRTSVLDSTALDLCGLRYVSVGEHTEIARGATLAVRNIDSVGPKPFIRIGDNCHIGVGIHITAVRGIEIGDGLLTGSNVLITDNSHGTTRDMLTDTSPIDRSIVSKGGVKIGCNVWLGNNVCVLSGITVGDGAIVAAGAVVTHDVPPYSLVAGVPARVIRQLKR